MLQTKFIYASFFSQFVNMDSLLQFLCQFLFFCVCIFSIYICFFFFFRELPLSRLKTGRDSDNTHPVVVVMTESKKTEESEDKEMADFFTLGQIEKSHFCFRFKFPTYDEFCRNRSENRDDDINEKYEEETELHKNYILIRDEDEYLEVVNFNEESVIDEDEENGEQLLYDEEEEEEEEEAEVCSMKGPFDMESDSDSSSSILFPRRFVFNPVMAIYSDGFLSDREFEPETPIYVEGDCTTTTTDLFPTSSSSSSSSSGEQLHAVGLTPELDLGDFEEDNTYNEMEMSHLRAMGNHENSDFLTDRDFLEEEEEEDKRETTTDKLEPLWEHQDLIEQLEMEMKKARATGLPTILEDSECPKLTEDLKPWKISDKYEHGINRIGEFQRFCKSYIERMRKFDILNFQKMYAIGFLHLKDPLRQVRANRTYVQSMKALVSNKVRSDKTNTSTNFIKELQIDLEVVYIGQMCLSWEFLRWQYERELEPWELDRRRSRRYNHVASEFQQFCVLLQRFMEDELVHGSRIHCYVKNRRILRNLLQVPLVRDDYTKEGKKSTPMRKNNEGDVTSDMLLKIIEESIKTFWEFLKADKDCQKYTKKINHLEPKDLELFVEIQKDLYKKDKHMRDALQSESHILKMFKRKQEVNNSYHHAYFLAQVDMRVVVRVLNMCKLTSDQLVWCRNKLNKINFVGKRIHVEPSFLLFPC